MDFDKSVWRPSVSRWENATQAKAVIGELGDLLQLTRTCVRMRTQYMLSLPCGSRVLEHLSGVLESLEAWRFHKYTE